MAVALVHTLRSTTTEIENAFENKYTIADTIKEIEKGNPLFECITDDMYVKPYFDWDADFETEKDMDAFKEPVWEAVKDDLTQLGFDLAEDYIYIAERFGFNPVKNKYKVSYRAFVQGIKMTPKDIKLLIKQTSGLSKYIDSAPYMSSQRLNMINTSKGGNDKRIFKKKFEGVRDSYEYYIVSNVKDTDKIRTVEMEQSKEIKKNYIETNPLQHTNISIKNILDTLDIKYTDQYDYWLRIGASLYNSGYLKSDFDAFSKRSIKYDDKSVNKLWNEFERKPLTNITFGTIMYFLKDSDKEYYNKVVSKLKTCHQMTEIQKVIEKGAINHSIVAKIFYEAYYWKYQYSNGCWYRLSEGGIYQKLSKDAEVFIAKEMKAYLQKFIMDVLSDTTDDDKRKKLWGAQSLIENNGFKMGCVAEAKQDFMNETLYKDLDTIDNLIGFTNGVFDLNTMEFRKGTIDDKVSMTTRFNYDDNLDEEKLDFIDEMIDGYFETAETSRWFKKHLGSLLIGGNKEEKGYFWVGNGRNGKGTIDGLLINTLGDYYHKLPNEFFTVSKKHANGPEPEILAMKNKRLCMTHEPEGSNKYLTSKFKTNTGNDPMSARAMYSDTIEQFNPSHKTIIQTNHLPEFTDIDNGLLARLVVINFPFKYCDTNDYDCDNKKHKMIDIDLKTKLKGIENDFINYLIRWYVVYKEEGLSDLSMEIKDSIKEYRKDVDSVKTFIEEALVKTGNDRDKLATTKLLFYHNGWSKQKLTKQQFAKRFKTNDIEVKKLRIDGVLSMAISGYKFNSEFIKTIEEEGCLFVADE